MNFLRRLFPKLRRKKKERELVVKDLGITKIVEYTGDLPTPDEIRDAMLTGGNSPIPAMEDARQADQRIKEWGGVDPASLHPSIQMSVGIETHAMKMREQKNSLIDRPSTQQLMEATEKLDGGTAPINGRIAKTDEEYHNRILPSSRLVGKGVTEAQMDVWNAMMTRGGKFMVMGRDKEVYVELNAPNPNGLPPPGTDDALTIDVGQARGALPEPGPGALQSASEETPPQPEPSDPHSEDEEEST